MPSSPWQRAYEQNQADQAQTERAEQQQVNAESAGLAGAIGMFAVMSLAPTGVRQGAKLGARRAGKAAAKSKSFGRAAAKARKYAKGADEVGGAASSASKTAKQIDERHWRKALSEQKGLDRLKSAAAYEAKSGGGTDLTRLARNAGFKGPTKARDRASKWRQFKQSEAAQQKGTLRAFAEAKNQRELIGSAAGQLATEHAVALPVSYGVDSALGVTGAPSDRAWHDVPGQVQDFVNYLPRYAAYEVAGTAALGGASVATKAAKNAASDFLGGNKGAAKAVSSTFQGMEKGFSAARGEARRLQDEFNQVKDAPASKWMQKGYEQGREYMMGRYKGAKDAVTRYMGRRASKVKQRKGKLEINQQKEVSGAEKLFGAGGNRRDKTAEALINDIGKGDGDLTKRLSKGLFVGEERDPMNSIARMFGGEGVTVSEVKKSGYKLRAADQEKMQKIKKGIDNVKSRVQAKAGHMAGNETQRALDQMTAGNLRASGYTRIGGEVMRMPTGEEAVAKTADAVESMTTVNTPMGSVSLGRMMGTGSISKTRPAAQHATGSVDIKGKLFHFKGGKAGDAGQPAGLSKPGRNKGPQIYEHGITVQSKGYQKHSIMAQGQDGKTHHIGDFTMSAPGDTKGYQMRMRKHYEEERYTRPSHQKLSQKTSGDPTGFIGQTFEDMKRSLRIGSKFGGGSQVFRRTKDYLSDASPGRLFSKESDLWNVNLSNISQPREAEPLADAVYHSRQAMVKGTDIYTKPQVFDKALKNTNLSQDQLSKLGGTQGILKDEKNAFQAAKQVMEGVTDNLDTKNTRKLKAPSTPEAKKIIQEVEADPNALQNPTGRRRAQTLRRFVFEQGALGRRAGNSKIGDLSKEIDDMVKHGDIREDLGLQAQVGLESLRMQKRAGRRLKDPYKLLSERSTYEVQMDSGLREAKSVIEENKDLYQEFAKSRPRLDTSYHRDSHTAPDVFSKPHKEAGFYATDPSMMGSAKAFVESGVDTMRRALGEVGLGWHPKTSLTTTEGLKELGKTWGRRAGAAAGATLAYRTMDAGTDIALPDDAPLGEGITQELSDIAANSRMAASYIYDQFGITDAAQYMEGLMPKSTSILPGAAAGAYAGGILGAVAGATLNRATQPLLTNTPFEALSILPPLAPFVSDMAEEYETTKAKYEGRKWVPVRSGRFYMLSSSNYEGGRIEQYRPNWYVEQSADVGATPVQYGSKMEEAIYKDLPLIDFAPGDLIDPDYLENRNAASRPYREAGAPFSEIPLIGPMVGSTVGRAYNYLHPLGDNQTPVQMDGVVGSYDQQGQPTAGGGNVIHRDSAMQQARSGGQFSSRQTITAGHSPDQVFDESFYRMTEAMGFTGFVTQSAAGGEGIFRRTRQPSADRIDSTARSYHDAQMGDMLGVGEAMRRLYPYERGGDKTQGPRNNMPDWMATSKRHGDPYCVLPDVPVEADGVLVEAEELYEQIKNDEQVQARTHGGRYQDIEAASKRPVDEDIVVLDVQGLPWSIKLTEEHPVLVNTENNNTEWRLAGEIEEGDEVMEPVGPEHDEFVCYEDETSSGKNTIDHTADAVRALEDLRLIQAPDHDQVITEDLSARAEWRIDFGFELGGSKRRYRRSKKLASLRRQLEDHGMPKTLPGVTGDELVEIVNQWGEAEPDNNRLRVPITPKQVRPDIKSGERQQRHESENTDREACRDAAYILAKSFVSNGTPASVNRTEDGYEVILRGLNAANVLFPRNAIRNRHRKTKPYKGREGTYADRSQDPAEYLRREVESVDREHYEGPVYAFQVAGDESFVVGGVATHNSKVAKGEALMPGEGLEATGRLTGGDPMPEASDIGKSEYGTALRMLGIRGDKTRRQKWAEEKVTQRMLDAGAAVRTKAVYVDNKNNVAAVADAATKGNQPIHVEAVSQAEFRSMENPREIDTQQLNATLGAAGRSKGMIAYVDQQSGNVRTFIQNFDSGLYNKTVRKLQRSKQLAKDYAAQGYGDPGAMYNSVDRLQVLQNADPFGEKWQVERKKAKKQYQGGDLSPEEQAAYRRITSQQQEMRKPFPMHEKRFSADQLLAPDDPSTFNNLSYNENVKAAANYSLPERVLGSVWQSATSMRTPLHSKFFGNYSPQEQYERKVLLERDFQSWERPVEDFIKPYASGLAATDDPLQGATSYAIGGATFGNPAIGAVGAVVGAAYGAGRGIYESMGGSDYIPSDTQETREQMRKLDRFQYHRSKRLYDATGSKKYRDKMMETATGWTQAGLEGKGWAKDRRRSFTPAERHESGLFGQDRGFASPYKGLKSISKVSDALIKHDSTILSMGKRTQTLDNHTGSLGKALKDTSFSAPPLAPKRTSAAQRASSKLTGSSKRANRLAESNQNLPSVNKKGLNPSEAATASRRKHTQIQSGRGFASPYRGENPEQAVAFQGREEKQSALPPEMLTGFSAMPARERDFYRPFMLAQDPQRQSQMLEQVSPRFGAMLETGWNYTQGRPVGRNAARMAPQPGGPQANLAAHPAMGAGASEHGTKIKTLEDTGMTAQDADLGWKGAMDRMENAIVQPAAIDSLADATQRESSMTRKELRQVLNTALAQMGVNADISMQPVDGPTEVHIREHVG